jgi:nitroreductase
MGTDTANALVEAARSAGSAPSVANSQPWHWRVKGDTLELWADPSRQLTTADPDGRLLTLSCGAALHHARVALAAGGWQVDIDRTPDPDRPDLLATLTVTDRIPVTQEAVALLQATRIRRTDRRLVSDEVVSPKIIDEVRAAAEAEHAWLHVLRPDDVLDLAAAASQAASVQQFDPQWRAEIRYWAGGSRDEGFGIPDSAIPRERPQTTVSDLNAGLVGDLPLSAGHDRAAIYAILYGRAETRYGWLRGGEALSAAWLAATEFGLSVMPLSATIEVSGTRQALRRLVSHLGEPYLVLRLGVPNTVTPGPPDTPRLPTEQVVEVVETP